MIFKLLCPLIYTTYCLLCCIIYFSKRFQVEWFVCTTHCKAQLCCVVSICTYPLLFPFTYCFGKQPFSLHYFQNHGCVKAVLQGMAEVRELLNHSCPDIPFLNAAVVQSRTWCSGGGYYRVRYPLVREQIRSSAFW